MQLDLTGCSQSVYGDGISARRRLNGTTNEKGHFY